MLLLKIHPLFGRERQTRLGRGRVPVLGKKRKKMWKRNRREDRDRVGDRSEMGLGMGIERLGFTVCLVFSVIGASRAGQETMSTQGAF